MSKTDKTFIDDSGNLTVRAVTVSGPRVSAPNKLSPQAIIDTPEGPELAIKATIATEIEDIPGLQDKLEALDASDESLQSQIEATNSGLESEVSERQTGDTNLQSQIDATNSALATETSRATLRENTIENGINSEIIARSNADVDLDSRKIEKTVVPSIMTDIEMDTEPVSISLVKTIQNTQTGEKESLTIPFPVANESSIGLAHPSLVTAVGDNSSRISTLEGASKRYPVHLGTDPLTQGQYQTAWETAAGVVSGTTPPDGSTLINLDNNHAITYFENLSTNNWVDRGVDTVGMANNSGQAGITKGSLNPGQIFVEPDGTMSLNNYDGLVASDEDAGTRLDTLEYSINNIDNDTISKRAADNAMQVNPRRDDIIEDTTKFEVGELSFPNFWQKCLNKINGIFSIITSKSNVDFSNTPMVRYPIATSGRTQLSGTNYNSGYWVIYSDGWVVQTALNLNVNGPAVCQLFIEMDSIFFNPTLGKVGNTAGLPRIDGKTTTTITIGNSNATGSAQTYWTVHGYGNEASIQAIVPTFSYSN